MGTDKHLEGLREQRLQEVREGVPGSSARCPPPAANTAEKSGATVLVGKTERRKDGCAISGRAGQGRRGSSGTVLAVLPVGSGAAPKAAFLTNQEELVSTTAFNNVCG